MRQLIPIANLLDERKEEGCVWCETDTPHPAYSLCPRYLAPAILGGTDPFLDTPPSAATIEAEPIRFGKAGEYALRMAWNESDRLRCWHLVYREYTAHGYMEPDPLPYRYGIHDALPDTATFLVEHGTRVAGTVTLFPDTPLELPADEAYRDAIDRLRDAGRRPVEVGRLVIGQDYAHERAVLANLFDALAIWSRRMMGGTDLVVTVNPSHAKFYERMLSFERIGGERDLGSVCGAPAVLLRLDHEREVEMRWFTHGEGALPAGFAGGRTLYSQVSGPREEGQWLTRMRTGRRSLSEGFLRRYFVQARPMIPSLPGQLRYFFDKCYPQYVLTRTQGGAV